MQYGIRLAKEDITLPEFLRLLSGMMPDTPLGRLVAVRAETNAEVMKTFGATERRIRAQWLKFAGASLAHTQGDLQELQASLAKAFGGLK